MGSALDAAKFSISQGFTGVSDPSSTFSAIDKGIKDLTDWQTKRKEDKEKLETDTATKYREAEKQAYENLPSGKNAQAQILSGLEEYKERLYTNMKLVQRGVIGANDNLIFRENGTQSFNILSDIVKDYDKQREEYIKGAEGYIDEKTGKLVEPIYGSVAAALQDMQTQIGNPDFTKLGFDSKGNGIITFYETKINEQTSTRELVLDKNGNPIPQKGLDGVNLIAYKNGRNQTALRVNLDQRTRDLVGKDSLLGKEYQTMISQGGMVGVVIDDIRGKDGEQVKALITNAAGNLITNVAEMASVLSDNGDTPSQVLNDRMWGEAKRNGADMDEKIPYSYVDLETGEIKTDGLKSKYIKLKTANNNQMVPILSEEDKLASKRIAQFSVYNSLERGISGGAQYRPPTVTKATTDEDDKKSYFNLIDDVVVDGNENSLSAIVRQDSKLRDYRFTSSDPKKPELRDQVVFMRIDGTPTAPIPIGSGSALDAGKLLSAELGYVADQYAVESRAGDSVINAGILGFKDFSKPKGGYSGLGNLSVGGISKIGGVTKPQKAADYLVAAEEEVMASTAQEIVDVARSKYDNIPNIKIKPIDVTASTRDKMEITVDGITYISPGGNKNDNYAWLLENLDIALRGQTPRGNSGSGSLDDLGEGPQ